MKPQPNDPPRYRFMPDEDGGKLQKWVKYDRGLFVHYSAYHRMRVRMENWKAKATEKK